MHAADRTDLRACHARLREGSRTFFAASLLLPRRVREPAAALYAFCRVADDAVDLGTGCEQNLAILRDRLAGIYSGQPVTLPEDRAFASVVRRFGIPRALPEALLEGFQWDIDRRYYDDLEDLHAYAARVAGTVGAMMAIIMGVRAPDAIARACELGMAMQLTNIARDVGEDARAGRLYLPRRWLHEAGIDPESWLASPYHSDALGGVVRRILRAADALYASADSGIDRLPPACRTGIRSARLIYTEIGREIERCGLDPVSCRTVVPAARKVSLVWKALRQHGPPQDPASLPVPEAAQFLVEAVKSSRETVAVGVSARPAAWWELNRRAVWVVELFDRLERREQPGR